MSTRKRNVLNGQNKRGNCTIPSELTEEDFAREDYPPGAVVWAKMPGHPWWAAMIEDSPDTQEFFKVDANGEELYHVTFFGEKPCRYWVKSSQIKEFKGSSDKTRNKRTKSEKFLKSVQQAEEALKISIKERLRKFSFAARYKGRWAKIDDESIVSLPPAGAKKTKTPNRAGAKPPAMNGDGRRKIANELVNEQAASKEDPAQDEKDQPPAGEDKAVVEKEAKENPMEEDQQPGSSKEQLVEFEAQASVKMEHDCRKYCRVCTAHEDAGESNKTLKAVDEKDNLDQSNGDTDIVSKDEDMAENDDPITKAALREFAQRALDNAFDEDELTPEVKAYHEFVKKKFPSFFGLESDTEDVSDEVHVI